jgi:hypothetical protein
MALRKAEKRQSIPLSEEPEHQQQMNATWKK